MTSAPGTRRTTSRAARITPPPLFDGDGQNAAAIEAEQLRAIGAGKSTPWLGFGQDTQFDNALALARTGRRASGEDPGRNDVEAMQRLANLRYLLVLVADQYVAPTMSGDDSFTEGSWSGRALLFDVSARQLLGAWLLSARSSSKVVGVAHIPDVAFLLDDLRMNLQIQLAHSVKQRIPDSVPPFAFLTN